MLTELYSIISSQVADTIEYSNKYLKYNHIIKNEALFKSRHTADKLDMYIEALGKLNTM